MRLWNPSFKKCAKLKQCVQWLKKFGWHAAGSVSVQVSSGGQAAALVRPSVCGSKLSVGGCFSEAEPGPARSRDQCSS